MSSVPIRLAGASKTFRREGQTTEALSPIDIDIASGEFFAVVGPSGCGKSTLLKMIAGLVPASTGTVTVAGNTVEEPVTDLGIVFQSPVLLDWRTVLGFLPEAIICHGHNTWRAKGSQTEVTINGEIVVHADKIGVPRLLAKSASEAVEKLVVRTIEPNLRKTNEGVTAFIRKQQGG